MDGTPRSFGDDSGFFREHHGDFVADRINALAGVAFEAALVGKEVHRLLTDRTNQDGKKLSRDRHGALREAKKDCSREEAG
jgi:hypothetical protein